MGARFDDFTRLVGTGETPEMPLTKAIHPHQKGPNTTECGYLFGFRPLFLLSCLIRASLSRFDFLLSCTVSIYGQSILRRTGRTTIKITMAVDASAEWVPELTGSGLAIVASSITLAILSLIVVGLRSFVRLRENVFGWDDGLMVGGLVSLNFDIFLEALSRRSFMMI